ncbi:endonuclease/exonuclease/phosphatase family protein [bacterium]|nr:endonuclease/exonuclease/phosphatase family protein [bacterium]
MRTRILWTLLMCSLLALATAAPAADEPAGGSWRFLSFNIRNGRAADGEDAWPNRREHVAALIQGSRADVAGLQEVFDFQREELLELLPEYSAWGIGRDARGGDEQCCLLYRPDRLLLLTGGTFWLSTTPGVPGSKSWDSSLPRICTWARFADLATGRTFYVYNCHFDHMGVAARLESARLVTARIADLADDDPVIVMGDLNTGEETEPLAALKETLTDSFRAIHPQAVEAGTFNGFKNERAGPKIDYIFIDGQADVLDAGISYDTYGAGRNISDHFPVWAEVRFE